MFVFAEWQQCQRVAHGQAELAYHQRRLAGSLSLSAVREAQHTDSPRSNLFQGRKLVSIITDI